MRQSLLQQPSHMVPDPSKPLWFLLCHFHPPSEFIEAASYSISRKPLLLKEKNPENLLLCVVLGGDLSTDSGEGWHWRGPQRTHSHLIFEGIRVGLGHWVIRPRNWEFEMPLAEFAGATGPLAGQDADWDSPCTHRQICLKLLQFHRSQLYLEVKLGLDMSSKFLP